MAFTHGSLLGLEMRTVCRTVQYELIATLWAIEDALNVSRTSFYQNNKATLKHREISLSDDFGQSNLRGLTVAPVMGGGSETRTNLNRVYSAIQGYVEDWTEGKNGHRVRMTMGTGGFTYYETLEEFAAAVGAPYVGAPSMWIWNDAHGAYWTSCMMLLSAMRSFAVLPVVERGAYQGGFGDDGSLTTYGTQQAAWTEALAETTVNTANNVGGWMILEHDGVAGRIWHAYQWPTVAVAADHAKALATGVGGSYTAQSFAGVYVGRGNLVGSLTAVVAGEEIELTGTDRTVEYVAMAYSPTDDTPIEISLKEPLPATQPFVAGEEGFGVVEPIVGSGSEFHDAGWSDVLGEYSEDRGCRFITDLSEVLD